MKITGYKIVYDIEDNDGKSTHEIQAFDLPDYVRKAIDQYFDYLEEDSNDDDDQPIEYISCGTHYPEYDAYCDHKYGGNACTTKGGVA